MMTLNGEFRNLKENKKTHDDNKTRAERLKHI
jgi:hypothetical protein